MKKTLFSLLLTITILCFSCNSNPDWDHSAAVLIKGKKVKVTMYGPYHDAINQWDEVKFVLDKIAETHAVKVVLIRVIDSDKDEDGLISNYVIRKVEKYFKKLKVEFQVRDERKKKVKN